MRRSRRAIFSKMKARARFIRNKISRRAKPKSLRARRRHSAKQSAHGRNRRWLKNKGYFF